MALNQESLERLWQHIIARLGRKVDKEEGKGLSSCDFTIEEKEKLKNLETNTRADWNETDPTSASYIVNTPTEVGINVIAEWDGVITEDTPAIEQYHTFYKVSNYNNTDPSKISGITAYIPGQGEIFLPLNEGSLDFTEQDGISTLICDYFIIASAPIEPYVPEAGTYLMYMSEQSGYAKALNGKINVVKEESISKKIARLTDLPCGEMPGGIYWDGDTTNKESVQIEEGGILYKISEETPDKESLVGKKIGFTYPDGYQELSIVPDYIISFNEDLFIVLEAAVVVASKETPLGGDRTFSPGIYFVKYTDENESTYTSYLETDNFIKMLDEKYIPDTIARVSQLEGFATEEYVDNALSNGSAPDVSDQIEEHNTSSSAHSDIRSSVSNALNEAKSYTDSTLDTAKTYTNTKVAELVNSAPETLDTLGEIATAIKANETVVDALNSAIGNKVDKVDGKGLSTNDYTTTEKNKLAGIEAGANAYSLPTASASTLGGVKIGTGIGISSGVISNSGVRSISTGSTNGTISVNTNGTSAEVAVKGLGSNAYNSTAYLPLAGGTVTGVTTFSNTTAASSTTTGAVKISGGLGVAGNIYGAKVYGAVWNDYAEYRSQNEKIEAGYIVYCDDDGKLKLTTERLQKFEGVVSDTFGFAIGETEECQTPIAVSGRVLVYCNPEEHFHSGDCVCAGPDGLAYYMTREEIMEYPDRIVGIVSEIPTYETWGSNNIKVNNRIWIRVR